MRRHLLVSDVPSILQSPSCRRPSTFSARIPSIEGGLEEEASKYVPQQTFLNLLASLAIHLEEKRAKSLERLFHRAPHSTSLQVRRQCDCALSCESVRGVRRLPVRDHAWRLKQVS